jgi:heme/copper-type cytochrome/quinol oxidase subunit 2
MRARTKGWLLAITSFLFTLFAFTASQTQAWFTFFAETSAELNRYVFYSNLWFVISVIFLILFIYSCFCLYRLRRQNSSSPTGSKEIILF